jgi:hypothetical protein
VFPIKNVARLGVLSPGRKFPFLEPEKCIVPIFTFWMQTGASPVCVEQRWVAPASGEK